MEDNSLNQLVAERVVSRLGYQVDIVANGEEALNAVDRTSYSALLMDCHMPVMDGFETTKEIRRREGEGRRTPIIAMTAGALPEDRSDAWQPVWMTTPPNQSTSLCWGVCWLAG